MARQLPPLPPPIRAVDRMRWCPNRFIADDAIASAILPTPARLAPEAATAACVATVFIARLRRDTATPARAWQARLRWTDTPAIRANIKAAAIRLRLLHAQRPPDPSA